MKRVEVTLTASVECADDHDAERYLEDVRAAFANRFSIYVHELYPDALVRGWVQTEQDSILEARHLR